MNQVREQSGAVTEAACPAARTVQKLHTPDAPQQKTCHHAGASDEIQGIDLRSHLRFEWARSQSTPDRQARSAAVVDRQIVKSSK